jgi:exosortase/archaeosortase family protein
MMKRFAVFYFLFLAILFVLLYAQTNPLSTYINDTQTMLTLTLLDLFLEPSQLQGVDIWITPNYKIIIDHSCNGIIPILFLSAAILAYPASFWHKFLWLVLGYLVFSLANVLRILLVVHFVAQEKGRGNFYWSHDLLGNALLMVVGLSLFMLFIKTSKRLKPL